jgi:hypothetical protein
VNAEPSKYVVTYRLFYGPGLLAKRLLRREGFDVEGPTYLQRSRMCRLQIAVEGEGRESRAVEIMRRWAPEAFRVGDGNRSGAA